MPFHASDSSALARLSRFMRRLSFIFSAIIIVLYLSLNLAVVYAPEWLAAPIGENTLVSRGIVIGLTMIFGAIAMTAFFVSIINKRGDDLREEVRRERQS